MRKSVPPTQSPSARRRRRPQSSTDTACLADLQRRFARFRDAHRRQTRTPDSLRSAALAALDQGVAPAELRRTCGLSWKQLQQWQGLWRSDPSAKTPQNDARRSPAVSEASQPQCLPPAQVFTVVDDKPAYVVELACQDVDHAFELRLDGLAISIRRAKL